MQVLLVNPADLLPADTREFLVSGGHEVDVSGGFCGALARANDCRYDAAIVPAPTEGDADALKQFRDLLRAIDVRGTVAIILGHPNAELLPQSGHLVDFASSEVSKEEIMGRLTMLLRYHGVVQALERDLDNMQRLFRQLNVQFTEVDQEMRLAGRLQNAFLPGDFRTQDGINFATLYRPATFVSGDIYDIFRVDEHRLAFYVADVVGHGMAASLLTMFVKNSVVSKRVFDNRHELLEPDETLRLLNQKLLNQQLPNSQFVTACYAMIDTRTRELQYSRAGHPYPFLCHKDGSMSELKSPGGLLGLFEGEAFPTQTVVMKPGEKLIFYSDGMEMAFAKSDDRADETRYYREVLWQIADRPAKQLVHEYATLLDQEAGSLNPKDDITLVVMEVDG